MKKIFLNSLLKKLAILAFLALTISVQANSNSNSESKNKETTWAEKLGFPAGKKVIILHADDAGMCEEANIATQRYLEKNQIQSAAIMVPCPNAEEMILWAKKNPKNDIGVHLTLTSEWKNYRWGPVADPAKVPGLVDPDGKFWHEVPDVVMHASAKEVEIEIRAQIDKVLSMGYTPTHLDTHMGTLYGSAAYVQVFLKVAEEYGIPANAIDLSSPEVVAKYKAEGYPITDDVMSLLNNYTLPKVDNFTSVPNGKTYNEKRDNFFELIKSLKPGITEIIFHPSTYSENLKTITNSWQQRNWEAELFSDAKVIQFFNDEGIVFTNWKEIMQRFKNNK
ncbi:MAG: polysaccharide deacetylase family protein [Draconibacterium sp.]|nr:polysaccharide deacetylase family protein [Draconibacterium sp.]